MSARCLLTIFSVLMIVRSPSTSSQPVDEVLTLNRAVELAIENNPSLKIAEANVRSASGGLTQATASYLPSLSASTTAQRTDGAFVLNPTFPPRNQSYSTYSAGFQANQVVFDFGRTINRVSASSRFADASSLDLDEARATVIANVQIAFFGLVQARQVLRVNERTVDQSSKHLTQAQAFYNVGRRPLFDVTKAEVDLANAKVNLIQARNRLHVANLQLENAIGVHPAKPYIVGDPLTVTPFAMTLDSVKQTAFARRPELQAAQLRVEANRSLVSAAWDQHLPTLSAFGSWTWSNFDFPLFSRWNAGITMTLPLFQGFSVVGQVEQAQAASDAAEANLEVLKESIMLEVAQAYSSLREAEERLDATDKLVEQAEQNLVLAEKQYAAGVGTPLDETDAQLSLSNAHITRIQALYDYSTSLVNLQKAMGVLGKE